MTTDKTEYPATRPMTIPITSVETVRAVNPSSSVKSSQAGHRPNNDEKNHNGPQTPQRTLVSVAGPVTPFSLRLWKYQ